ncbi:putative zinc transporter msc2 [Puccinia graminis f. sp. tritici]|uniref:Putative zinc transporter msc2 n=1 Tax=Puccinia graminis f. sp. tritici TaxID=56615 RepID=A0A5B0RS88_PUCGR|nr:putative zinc transporter msc2 [Puccinia graminis f. sp. tritici]KAA1127895.1 putative zinc transporter msc2 [Puccinia graminis f. sp. tritici]
MDSAALIRTAASQRNSNTNNSPPPPQQQKQQPKQQLKQQQQQTSTKLIQAIGYSYSIHASYQTTTNFQTISLALTTILTIQSILALLLLKHSTPTTPSPIITPTIIIIIILDHLFLLYSITKLSSGLSIILITTSSSKWAPSISQLIQSLLTKPSSNLNHSGLLGLCMLVGCFTIDLYLGSSDPNPLLIGYLSLFAHLLFRGLHLSNQQNEKNPRKRKSALITAAAISLILSLTSFLLPSSAHPLRYTSTPDHLGSWITGLAIYSIINHFSLNEACNATRQDPSSDSEDLLSLMMVRMLSCELAGTMLFDHPMGNFSDRLIGLVSYLGISSMVSSSSSPSPAHKSLGSSSSQHLKPMHTMSLFFRRARSVINTILANPESRNIYLFLCLNLAFMLIQMTYGIWTNSLGLISDSIHMFFDCMALGMGLFASVMATWPADKQFTYGYGRVETLSGFANGVFLMLISIFIVFEAIQRLVDPPEMNTNQLLAVSFIGLLVNLVGMFATGHHHHHHGHSHDHDHDHGHSHNMKGVFLHVMADTLGSVGVIISTLLIERYGWTGFDPIASIFIALLIFASVVPLVLDSAKILLLCLDDETERQVRKALGKLSTIEGLSSYSAPRFWPKDGSTIVGSLHLQLSPTTTSKTADSSSCSATTTTSGSTSTKTKTTGIGLESPLMMIEEQEELFSSYSHATRVSHLVTQSLATLVPSLAELNLQLEGIDGSKFCFCLTGPNS